MEIKNHFGVYGVCLQDGKLLCIEKTRGPYQHRFDLPGGSQELGEGLTETLKREVLEETGYMLSRYSNPRVYDVLVQEEAKWHLLNHYFHQELHEESTFESLRNRVRYHKRP